MMAANSAYTIAVNRAMTPAIINPRNTAGPAIFAATPVRENTPDPIVFPKPSKISEVNPKTGLNFYFFYLLTSSNESSFWLSLSLFISKGLMIETLS
jgi:hypothetical protein